MSFPTDLEIARKATAKPLPEIAAMMGIGEISLAAIDELADRPRAKYVVVTAITPTPLGEGKTTTTVGLGQAMKHIGKNAVTRFWVAAIDAIGQEGQPSSPVWFGKSYRGFYDGEWHQ